MKSKHHQPPLHRTVVMLEDWQIHHLHEMAKTRNVSFSQVVRDLINQCVNRTSDGVVQ